MKAYKNLAYSPVVSYDGTNITFDAGVESDRFDDPATVGSYIVLIWNETLYPDPSKIKNWKSSNDIDYFLVTSKSVRVLTGTELQEGSTTSLSIKADTNYGVALIVSEVFMADLEAEVDANTDHKNSTHAPSDANNYSHPASHSPSVITQDTDNRFVTDAEKSTWNGKAAGDHNHSTVYEPKNTNIQTHVGSAHAPSDANNYTHPASHAPSIITQDSSNRFTTDTEKSTWNGKADASHDHKKAVIIKVFDDATDVATGDGKYIFMVPLELNGMNLVDCEAFVTTVSSSGLPTVQVRNITDTQDMLSTRITIDASENSSLSAVTAPVINASYDDVSTGDFIAIDVDVAGTGAKGLGVILSFQLP
ncbi:MAG: hypothetical protein KKA84_12130 [Bacteroidetes bacterium]|nr:hypothetical protein [Bacteroidota bacterium]